jgi:hypothetical protein
MPLVSGFLGFSSFPPFLLGTMNSVQKCVQ